MTRLAAAALGPLLLLSACAQTGEPFRRDEAASTSVSGAYLASRYAALQGDAETARAYLREALRRAPQDVELLSAAFMLALEDGEIDDAAAAARRIAKRRALNDSERLALAVDAFRRGRRQDALAFAGEDASGFDALAAELVAIWSEVALGRPEAGLARLEEARGLRLVPEIVATAEGLIHQGAGDLDAAAAAFERAAEGQERDFTIVDAYGRLLEVRGEREKAEALYARALDLQPAHIVAERGLNRIAQGRTPDLYEDGAERGLAVGLQKLALRLAAQRFSIGAAFAAYAAAVDPSFADAWSLLGEIRALRGDHLGAATAYGRVPDGAVTVVGARLAQARALFDAGRTEAALRILDIAPDEDADPRLELQRARLLHRAGRLDEAHAVYTRHIEAAPEGDYAAEALYARANLQITRERWREARQDLRRALAVRPDDPRILNDLGYVLIDRGDRAEQEEGLRLAVRALQRQPTNAAYLDTVGWGHFRLGRYEAAIAHLEKAVANDPASALLLDHLGDAYWRAGRRREARHQWGHALDLKPDAVAAAALRRKLDEGLAPPEDATDLVAADEHEAP